MTGHELISAGFILAGAIALLGVLLVATTPHPARTIGAAMTVIGVALAFVMILVVVFL